MNTQFIPNMGCENPYGPYKWRSNYLNVGKAIVNHPQNHKFSGINHQHMDGLWYYSSKNSWNITQCPIYMVMSKLGEIPLHPADHRIQGANVDPIGQVWCNAQAPAHRWSSPAISLRWPVKRWNMAREKSWLLGILGTLCTFHGRRVLGCPLVLRMADLLIFLGMI